MRTDLDHLPLGKRLELERIVEMLFQEFEDAVGRATGKRRSARILKIILFGSYSRDDWVDAPGSGNAYKSDYDLLIIVNQDDLTDRATYWHVAEERLAREYGIRGALRTPANFIVHTLQQVNDGLAHGRIFFMELKKGIVLYQSDDRDLHEPKPKTPTDAYRAAKEYFEEGLPNAADFIEGFQFYMSRRKWKKAAFLLQQATEVLYQTVMLVVEFYTPYNHNIVFLRDQAERLDRRLFDVWPRSTRRDRAMYQKLKDAYVKARYSRHYRISEEELTWLGERVEELGKVIHTICMERISALARAAVN